MTRGTVSHWGVALAVAALVALGTVEGSPSIPINVTHLQCLQPVDLEYDIRAPATADLAQEAVVFEEMLADAGLPAPLVEISDRRLQVTTYAASQPDLERVEQLVRRELGFCYPGYRPLREAHFRVSEAYAQQAKEVVVRRLELAGYEGQSGVLGPNRFWVRVHTEDTGFQWVWERRGMFEVRLLPGDIYTGFSREQGQDPPWRATAHREFAPVNVPLLLLRSPLVISNHLPARDTNVWPVPREPGDGFETHHVVSVTLEPAPATRLREATATGETYGLAFVWDRQVIDWRMSDHPIDDPRVGVGSVFFEGDVGGREAGRFAVCLASGPLPVPLLVEPPKVELPASVTDFLGKAYPEWRLLTYHDYGPAPLGAQLLILRRMEGEDYHPFAMCRDLDGDGKPDWAVLMKRGEQVRLLALHHAGTTWESHVVTEFPYETGFREGISGFNVHLARVLKGMWWSRDWDVGPLADLPGEGFELVYAGKAAWLWRWDGRQYRRFLSQD